MFNLDLCNLAQIDLRDLCHLRISLSGQLGSNRNVNNSVGCFIVHAEVIEFSLFVERKFAGWRAKSSLSKGWQQ